MKIKSFDWARLIYVAFALLTSGIILFLSVLIFVSGSSIYGPAVRDETKEWSKGAIVNFTIADKCPMSYELVTGTFYGTQDVCYRGSDYFKGGCGKNGGN